MKQVRVRGHLMKLPGTRKKVRRRGHLRIVKGKPMMKAKK